MKQIGLRWPEELIERIDKVLPEGVSRSEFIRRCVLVALVDREELVPATQEVDRVSERAVAVAPGRPEVPDIPGLVAASTLVEPTEGRCRHDKYRIVRNWGRICEACEMFSRDEGKTWQA